MPRRPEDEEEEDDAQRKRRRRPSAEEDEARPRRRPPPVEDEDEADDEEEDVVRGRRRKKRRTPLEEERAEPTGLDRLFLGLPTGLLALLGPLLLPVALVELFIGKDFEAKGRAMVAILVGGVVFLLALVVLTLSGD